MSGAANGELIGEGRMDEAAWLRLRLGKAEPLPVFPVNPSTKAPLISAEEGGRGFHTASRDPAIIAGWRHRFRGALFGTATGAEAGFVVLDIDVCDEVDGWHTLEEMGVSTAPETPMSHTPRGGTHCYFAHPGGFVKTIAGKLGRGLDIRGDGGSVILSEHRPGAFECANPRPKLFPQIPLDVLVKEPFCAADSVQKVPLLLEGYLRSIPHRI